MTDFLLNTVVASERGNLTNTYQYVGLYIFSSQEQAPDFLKRTDIGEP